MAVNKKKISYISKSNKCYNLSNNIFNNKKKYILIIFAIVINILSILLISKSIFINFQNVFVEYNELGNIDYKVYLKDNNYYNQKYLDKGMEYVASIISTVNPEFNYELHSTKNMDYTYKYKVIGNLIISKTNEKTPLYNKEIVLLNEEEKRINSNNLIINENLIIDYEKYNDLVNSYKKDMGLSVDSKLIITMYIDVIGNYQDNSDKLIFSKDLQMSIPLSEQTILVNIDTQKIDNNGVLSTKSVFKINNLLLFSIGIVLLFLSILAFSIYLYSFIKFKRKNIYKITLKKILNEYDRLIVNSVSIQEGLDENKYKKIVRLNKFSELVDAAINLNTNILFYEVIPDEESYFVIMDKDILYKFKLTKGYLEQSLKNGKKGY